VSTRSRSQDPDVGRDPSALGRREFLHSALGVAAALHLAPDFWSGESIRHSLRPPAQDPFPFELNEITIDAMQRAMAEGKYTARSATELYLRRIDQIDRRGPQLRSVIETNPEALAIADALDQERRAGRVRGPLHGIPVLVKDVVDTADRMRTTAGSLALAGSFAPRDAFIIRQLRQAGAIILGKTNMSEWSNVRSTRATSGWSARGGLTKNPYVLDRTACGSSSGAGAATAANLAVVGVGAETDGSIACPASANALVGIKPTLGLISRSGLIPVSYSQDTAGPIARTVTDAAILLGVLAGVDPNDGATASSASRAIADYTKSLDRGALKGARIGVIRRQRETDPALDTILDESVALLASEGAVIVRNFEIPSLDELQGPETFVLICEFKDAIRDYLATRGPDEPHRSLADLIRFNEENAEIEMAWFGQDWFEASEKTQGRRTDRYQEALAACRKLSRTDGLDRVLGAHKLDALVGLAATAPFMSDLVSGDRPIVRNTSLSAVSGYPRITLPAGFIHGLPVGLSFMGGAWSEPRLLGIAFAFEQASKVRRAPQFLEKPNASGR
jgi:amidase